LHSTIITPQSITIIISIARTMKFDVEWESYHADGRKRVRPPASTIHGWLTKMRGTLLDNETLRRNGIKEMQEARAMRLALKKRDAARAASGKQPSRPKARQPFLRLSFLRNRPRRMRKKSSGAVSRHKSLQSSRPKPRSHSSSKKTTQKKSSQGSSTSKRSTAHKRSGRPAKKGSKK